MSSLDRLQELNTAISELDDSDFTSPEIVTAIADKFKEIVDQALQNKEELNQFADKFRETISQFGDYTDVYSQLKDNETIKNTYKSITETLIDASLASPNPPSVKEDPVQPPAPSSQPPTPPSPPTPGASNQQPTAPSPISPNLPSSSEQRPSSVSNKGPSESEKILFKKFHGTSFDPNSTMDKRKMDMLRQAEKEVGSKDESKLRRTAYDFQYGKKTPSSKSDAKSPTVQFGDTKQPTYIQVAGGKFIPATSKDVSAGNQIWIKNPRKGQGETLKPNYVQVRTEKGGSLRPKSQLPGTLGSLSNFLGDVGNTLDKTSRKPRR